MKKHIRTLMVILAITFMAASCAPGQPAAQDTATPPSDTAIPTAIPTPQPPSVPEIVEGLTGLPFDEFVEESYRQLLLRDPDNLIYSGCDEVYGAAYDQFTDLSQAYLEETGQLEAAILNLLQDFDQDSLTADQQISYDCYEWYLDMQVQGQAFAGYKFLINPVWGLQNSPIDLLSELPLESKQDADNYISRLANMTTWAAQVIEGLALNEQVGALPPRFVIDNTIAQIDMILGAEGVEPAEATRMEEYIHFRSKIRQMSELSDDERDAYLEAAEKEIGESFIPAYQAIKDQLTTLATTAVEDPNTWKLPGGEAYYNYLLAYMIGTDLSADEIHALGLAEVARIQTEIQEAAVDLGLPADLSMAELNRRIGEESTLLTGEALLQKYEQVLAEADEASKAVFDLRPNAEVAIEVVPDGPPAYFAAPKPGSDEPGVMPVNLDISPQLFNYNEHVLVHHETIPGHYIQVTLAQELDVPGFQRYSTINPYLQEYILQAYVEGWALYSEGLAWEMGLYEGEPWANLGRLRLSLLRAVRTVVDTGIHAKGWTLDEASDYLEEVTGTAQNHSGLTRYLVNPGYPTGYFIGWVKIKEMRQLAEEQLGEAFDIKVFHNAVLGQGILPIQVMEQILTDWIDDLQNP
ncbi:MAG: DUF885 domain-containing protein [Anaerolineales bacterium]